MARRIVTGLILAAVVIGAVGFGPFALLAPMLGAALLAAMHEFLSLSGALGRADRISGVAAGAFVLAVASAWPAEGLMKALVISCVSLSVGMLLFVLFRPRPMETAGARASTLVTGLVYVVLSGSFAILMARPENGPLGRVLLLVAAAVTWLNDTMAFFGGKLMGRHPLYRLVSPKKTWEGSATGIAGSVIGAFLVKYLFVDLAGITGGEWPVTPLQLAVFAIGGGALGQAGDLVESVFKRSYGVKDSGTIVPGHGGMLDRIDAFLFVAPFGYLFFYVLS